MGKGYVFNCVHICMCICSCPYMNGWAIVNKSLQITADENRMKFMDRDCFSWNEHKNQERMSTEEKKKSKINQQGKL